MGQFSFNSKPTQIIGRFFYKGILIKIVQLIKILKCENIDLIVKKIDQIVKK